VVMAPGAMRSPTPSVFWRPRARVWVYACRVRVPGRGVGIAAMKEGRYVQGQFV